MEGTRGVWVWEGEGREGGKGEKRRESGKKGRVEGGEGGKEGIKGKEREGVGRGAPPPPHDLFAPRPCQYSGRREASFELSNA